MHSNRQRGSACVFLLCGLLTLAFHGCGGPTTQSPSPSLASNAVPPVHAAFEAAQLREINADTSLAILSDMGILDHDMLNTYQKRTTEYISKSGPMSRIVEFNFFLSGVPPTRWHEAARRRGLTANEFHKCTNFVATISAGGYDPTDMEAYKATLLQLTGKSYADYQEPWYAEKRWSEREEREIKASQSLSTALVMDLLSDQALKRFRELRIKDSALTGTPSRIADLATFLRIVPAEQWHMAARKRGMTSQEFHAATADAMKAEVEGYAAGDEQALIRHTGKPESQYEEPWYAEKGLTETEAQKEDSQQEQNEIRTSVTSLWESSTRAGSRLAARDLQNGLKWPGMVLFAQQAKSKCGLMETSAYCPSEPKIYIDTTEILYAYRALGPTMFHAAVAYTHGKLCAQHLQNSVGILAKIESMRERTTPEQFRRLSTLAGLQAEFISGVIMREMSNATEMGDTDWRYILKKLGQIQGRPSGAVVTEGAGASDVLEARVHWIAKGLREGDLGRMDEVFSADKSK